MVFNILIIVATGLVAFFHYIQGLLSATISAILIVIAAVIAVNYHELLAQQLITKIPDYAVSLSLVVIFAATYTVLRLIFDRAIPGNVRFPVLMDKIGAGAVGLLAGLVSTGLVAVAIQALPFGPTIGLYGRFATSDKSGSYPSNNGQSQEVKMLDAVTADYFDPNQQSTLALQQDDLVVGLVKKLSDGGSLAGSQPLAAIHPDYLTELFGERLGIQVGARHSLVNTDARQLVKVSGVYLQDRLTQVDGDLPDMHLRDQSPALVLQFDKESGQTLLIVRAVFTGNKEVSDDNDSMIRFSPGSVRLMTGHNTSHGADFEDYYPIATLDPRGVAVACRIDDYFLIPSDGTRTIDFIFAVKTATAFGSDMPSQPPYTLAPGSFLAFKRYGIVDLSEQKVDYGPPFNPDHVGILRPHQISQLIDQTEVLTLAEPPGVLAPGAPTRPGVEMGGTGLKYMGVAISNRLSDPVDVHGDNQSNGEVSLASVRGDYANRQWQHLRALVELSNPFATPSDATSAPTTPDNVDELQVDAHMVMVQLHCQPDLPPNPKQDQAWEWIKSVQDVILADRNGHTYTPVGVWAKSKITVSTRHRQSEMDLLNVSFGSDAPQEIPQMGVPSDVWIAYRVPADTVLREFRVGGAAVVENLSIAAK